MIKEELLQQAKIQGFSQAVFRRSNECTSMPFYKQVFIQEVAEIVLDKMVNNNVSYNNDVKQCEYINEVLAYIFKGNISKEELDDIFELTFGTLGNLIRYLLENSEV